MVRLLMPIFPVPILNSRLPTVSDHFGFSATRNRLHAGSDIMYRRLEKGEFDLPVFSKLFEMPNGIPALAFDSGVVTKSGVIGTGGRVEIDHGGGLATKYFHLRNIRVREGDRVKAGQVVGTISHNPTGFKLNHLHFEVLKNAKQVDPEPFLKGAQMVEAPADQKKLLLTIAVVVGAGFLASRYIR